MWEKLAVAILPKIWVEGFNKLEKQDIVTKALRASLKNPMIKKTWKSFLQSVKSFMEDAIEEINMAESWDIDNM